METLLPAEDKPTLHDTLESISSKDEIMCKIEQPISETAEVEASTGKEDGTGANGLAVESAVSSSIDAADALIGQQLVVEPVELGVTSPGDAEGLPSGKQDPRECGASASSCGESAISRGQQHTVESVEFNVPTRNQLANVDEHPAIDSLEFDGTPVSKTLRADVLDPTAVDPIEFGMSSSGDRADMSVGRQSVADPLEFDGTPMSKQGNAGLSADERENSIGFDGMSETTEKLQVPKIPARPARSKPARGPLGELNVRVGPNGLVFPHSRRRTATADTEMKPPKAKKSKDYGIEGDLFKAVIRDDLAAVEAILPLCDNKSPRNPADLDGLGKGATPLHLASQRGFLDVAKKLVSAGAALQLPTLRGLTPLHSAAQGGRVEVVKFLLAQGAQSSQRTLAGATAFDLAAQCADVRSRKRLAHALKDSNPYGPFPKRHRKNDLAPNFSLDNMGLLAGKK